MRKRIVLTAAIGGVFVVGLLGGMIVSGGLPVFASSNATQSSPTTGYCQQYEQALAQQLGVSTSQLSQANQSAIQTVITQLAKDGKITAAQQAKLEQRVKQFEAHPCASLLGRHGNHKLGKALGKARLNVATAVAGKLGVSVDTLKSDLKSGQTLQQIAAARNVSTSDLNTAYLTAVKAQLDQAVANKTLTSTQENTLYTRIQQAVQKGHYPLLQARGAKPTV
ncbi:MAG: hypothetical protein ACRDHE_15625 [Ktedonobacterales bacterium]